MTDPLLVSVGFSAASGVISFGLLLFAIRAYMQTRDAAMAFLASAFTIFMLKSFLVAYSLKTELIPHDSLELVDATGDLATVLMLATPLLFPGKPHEE